MCLIQYNYMDEHSQAGRKGLYHAHAKGIPVMIMEPLRGGELVKNLPQEATEIFAAHSVQHTPTQWAFRWLWNQPEVSVVLSGMNSDEMVADNIQTACETEIGELTADDEAMLKRVVRILDEKIKVGCTGCNYCAPCPQGINISAVFSAYNRRYAKSKFAGFKEYVRCTTGKNSPASMCIGCGKCETHCPQSIDIRAQLKEIEKEFETNAYKRISKLFGKKK